MAGKTTKKRNQNLRKQAEKILRQIGKTSPLSKEDVEHLARELEVHQIELEIQKQTLKETQEELIAARDRYAELYEFAPVGYLTLNENNIILESNLTLCQMLESTRSRLLRQNFTKYCARESQDAFYIYSRQVRQEHSKKSIEITIRKDNGQSFIAQLTMVGTNSNNLRVAVIEITEQKRSADALKESQKKYRSLIQTTNDFIWETAPGASTISDKKTMKKTLKVLIVEDSIDDSQLLLMRLQRAGYTLKYEIVDTIDHLKAALDKQSWDIVISDYILPGFDGMDVLKLLRDKGLDIPCIIVSGKITDEIAVATLKSGARDYIMKDNLKRLGPVIERELLETEIRRDRKLITEKLRESEERFSRAFHSSAAAFTITTIKDGIIIDTNDAYQRLTGYSREELIGHKSTELNLWADPRQRYKLLRRLNTEGKVRNVDIIIRTKEGRLVNTIFSVEIIHLNGRDFALSTALDITERKKAEEALVKSKNELEIKVKERTAKLAESEEKYRKVIENADEVISVVQDGLIKFMNKKGLELTGFSLKEIISKSFLDVIHPDDRNLVLERYNRRIEGKAAPSSYEIRVITKDESTRWAQINPAKIIWEEKPAILAMFTDITERKQAEEKLTQLIGFRELLTEIAARFISVPLERLDQEILDSQRRLCEYLDLDISSSYLPSPETAPSLKLTYLYRRLEKPSVPELLIAKDYFPWCEKQLISGQTVVVPSTKNLPPEAARDQSSWQHFGIKSSLMFPLVAGDEVIGTLSFDMVKKEISWPDELVNGLKLAAQVFANAIARKKTEEALIESENKAKALIEHAPTAIYEIDILGTHFISVNDAMCKITGYTREELLAMNPIELLEENSRKLFAEIIKSKLEGFNVKEKVDFRARKKDGTLIDITLQAAFSQSDPNIVFVIGHDITERKTMERALNDFSQRLIEVQEAERKRIAYELHDDTAQYLAIIKMQLNALIHSGKIQTPEIIEKLQYLEKDADQAFNDVRRYSHELRPVILERTGLTAALEQIVEDYNKLGQLAVQMKVGGSEPELSEEIKLGFFRIAQEALNNSRKHSKASSANITLTFREAKLEMVVSDNGIGFDVNEAAARSSGKGSLGLMSMRERAKTIEAELIIDSEPGKGTRVIVKSKI